MNFPASHVFSWPRNVRDESVLRYTGVGKLSVLGASPGTPAGTLDAALKGLSARPMQTCARGPGSMRTPQREQLVVEPAELHQLVVASVLDDPTSCST